jgi:hypothetical protein
MNNPENRLGALEIIRSPMVQEIYVDTKKITYAYFAVFIASFKVM